MIRKKTTLEVDSSSHYRLNDNDTAHFITAYDEKHLAILLDEVRAGTLSVTNRLQLLDEATLLARGGMMPSAQLLNIVSAYENETSESVWSIIFIVLAELRKFVETDKEAEDKLRNLSGKMAKAEYERLGWTTKESESEEDAKLRATMVSLMLYSEDPEALAMAKKIYDETELESIDPELRTLIISSRARYGDATIVDTLLDVYKKTSSGSFNLIFLLVLRVLVFQRRLMSY